MYALLLMLEKDKDYDTEVLFYLDGTPQDILNHDWQAHVDEHMKGSWKVINVQVVSELTVTQYVKHYA